MKILTCLSLFSLWLVALAQCETWQGLRAGFAEADISPGAGLTPFGYDFRGEQTSPGNAGVHDPLRCRVVALSDGALPDKPLVIVSFDLCVLPGAMVEAWRPLIAERAHTTVDRVILTATHTHSAPFADVAEKEGPYLSKIKDAVLDAVARAEGLRFPVSARFQAAPLGLAYDRRVKTPEGIRMNWNPQEYPDRPAVAAADPTCSVLMFCQENGPRQYVMWSLGAHPVVLGKTSPVISADFPGRACELIQQYLPDSKAMFFMAAAGHSQPWISTQENPAKIEPVARAAASFVALLTEATHPVGSPKIAVAQGTVASGAGKLPLTVARIGEVRLMAVPVELFEELALDLRKRAGGPVFLMSLANGWCEYLPHRAAFAEGGYEVDAARANGYQPGDGEALVEALLALDRELP